MLCLATYYNNSVCYASLHITTTVYVMPRYILQQQCMLCLATYYNNSECYASLHVITTVVFTVNHLSVYIWNSTTTK